MRRRVGALACLLGVAVLTGCAGIPSSGPVRQAGTTVDQRAEPFTRIIAAGPVPNMTQEQIVQGFLLASASFDDNHAVARQFLTPDRAHAWNADVGATVYRSDTSQGGNVVISQVGPDRMRFTAPQAGTLSEQGAYSGSPPGTVAKADFQLKKVAGQWRIATLPPGLLLTTNDVGRAYRPYDIYFPDPARTVVVPDQILVPVGPGASTSLVRALLSGPTPWLAPAVRSAIPTGTKLVVDAVPVTGGVVQVDLTAPAANVSRVEAQAMAAQFAWTLRQVSGVTTMRLTVDGVPLRVPSAGDVQSILGWSSFDPDGGTADSSAFAVAKGRAVVLRNKLQPVLGPFGDGSTVVSQVVPSFDGTELAALDKDRHRLLVGGLTAGAKVQALVSGTVLSAPSWDRLGGVWVVDRSGSTSTVWEAVPGGAKRQVTVTGLPKDGTVRALRLARDGVRVAALVVDAQGIGQLYVGVVERSDPTTTLTGFRLVNTGFVQSSDFSWASADRLVVLGRSKPNDIVQPWLVDLNGSVEQGLGPAGTQPIVSVGAAPTQRVLASTADGQLLWYSGFGWDSTLGEGAFPAYPG